MKVRTADIFTSVRIVAAPIFIFVYFMPQLFGLGQVGNLVSVCILIPLILFAEFTDFLDGYFARKQNLTSDFGKIFDPFADVILHLSVFYCYVKSGYIVSFILLLFAYREFGILFLRVIVAKNGIAIGARKGGKIKTVLYIAAGFFSLFLECCLRISVPLPFEVLKLVGYALYVAGLIASYVSFIDYLIHFIPLVNSQKK